MTSSSELLTSARDADLEASGLATPDVVRKLKLTRVLSVEETKEVTGVKNAIAYEIPYFDTGGRAVAYSRFKLIYLKDAGDMKYWQREKTIPRLYFPPLVKWAKLASDPSKPVVLTEGEKKAACGCLHDMNCIGLGGVWNWRAKKWGQDVLSDFKLINWEKRDVEICFDGDLYSNENVSRALGALTAALSDMGARVSVRHLPNTEGKTGMDDFLVAYGREAYAELPLTQDSYCRELHALNEDVVYLKSLVSYYSPRERVFYQSPAKLRQRYGSIKIDGGDGKPIAAIDRWIEWPHMRMVDGLTYEPGQGEMVGTLLNEWQGWGTVPKKGDVSQVLEVIKGIGDAEFQRWLLQWMAYPIQFPGTKMYSAVVLWAVEQGTGKSFLGYLLSYVYGKNAGVITDKDLHDERYSWMRNRQFVLGEEVTQAGRRQDISMIKHLITGHVIRVDEKYVPAYDSPNRVNFMFTSNHPDAFRLDPTDRRFAVAEVTQHRPEQFWQDLHDWARADGAAEWHWYLKNKVDLTGFNPRAKAIMTEAKQAMIYSSMSGLEEWVANLLQNPDQVLGEVARISPGKDVFQASDLWHLVPEEQRKLSGGIVSLSKALIRSGAVRGGVFRTSDGVKRLVAVRNLDWWRANMTHYKAWIGNYEGKLTVADFGAGSRRKKREQRE